MKRLIAAFLFLLLAGAACNGVKGTTVGNRQHCEETVQLTVCDGSIRTLKGTTILSFADPNMAYTVAVNMQISVEEGDVRVYVETPKGGESSVMVRAGQSAALNAVADTHVDTLKVYLEAQGEKAEGIQYHIEVRPQP